MNKNLGNQIFLFLSLDKFILVALNPNGEFIYKEETPTNNKSNQFDQNFLDNFLNENIFKIEKKKIILEKYFFNN